MTTHFIPAIALRRWLLIAVLALAPLLGTAAPYLINAQQRSYQTEPKFIRDRLSHIESLPFDGMTISTATGRLLMNGAARSYAQMALDFGPLNGLVFARLKHNFAVVNVHRPADFFDDWSVTIQNFRLLARSLKLRRIEGIFFDNEEYESGLFNYPADCSYPSRTLAEYQTQARQRGREIMQAMVKEHPAIVFIALHGPYTSFDGTPDAVRRGQTDWRNEQLRGAFSTGLIEGLGKQSTFVDGGEVYAYRTESDFQTSYDFRKTTIASAAANCPFIPAALRPLWPAKVNVAFGVYNQPFGGASMTPAILRPTLERALRRSDQYVWLYAEGLNWNAPGETTQDWADAVAGARAAASSPGAESAPLVEITSPGNRSLFSKANPLTVTANASSPGHRVSNVEFFRGAFKVGESAVSPYRFVWTNPPPGTWRLTAKATDDRGTASVSSGVIVTISSHFVARINFQPAGVTPAVGYLPDAGDVYGARSHGLTYGWNVSHLANARHRGTNNLDLHLATLCQIQSNGRWEIAVPNGIYLVTVGIGDGDYASSHTVNVEGVDFWTGRPLEAGHFLQRSRRVTVSDGKLTLDQGDGGFETTRVNYLNFVGP